MGSLTLVQSGLDVAILVAPDQYQPQLQKIFDSIRTIKDPVIDYKAKSKTDKEKYIKQFSKAAELALRVLNNENLDDNEFDQLQALNPSE